MELHRPVVNDNRLMFSILAELWITLLPLAIGSGARADEPLFPAPFKSGKYGYVDGEGKIVIAAAYAEAHPFSEQLALVNTGTYNKGTYGFIDTRGQLIVESKWSWAGDFRCGRAWVYDPDTHLGGFIDTKGTIVVPFRYKTANDFEDGIALVGVVEGVAKPLAASVETAVLEPLGLVRWTYIDRYGVELGMRGFTVGSYGSAEQLAPLPAKGRSSKVGYVNMRGTWAISPQFDRAHMFRNGLALVSVGGQQGFIDSSGKWRIGPKDWSCGEFSEKRATFSVIGSKSGVMECGLIDPDGRTVLPACEKYAEIGRMSEGLAVAANRTGCEVKYGYLDINGAVAIEPRFDSASAFCCGLALVRSGQEHMYIDRNGRVVWHNEMEVRGLRR